MEQRPIIIKRIKKTAHAHHGGSWKVAYADFVTAMMAFFLLMWLLGFTTEGERKAISDYFQSPSAIQGKGGSSSSLIDMGKGMDSPRNSQKKPNQETTAVSREDVPTESSAAAAGSPDAKMLAKENDKKRLESLLEELKQAIDASQALKPYKDQLLLDISPEGLRLQIVDKENRPMFDIGSANLQSYTRGILHEISKVIAAVPNRISIAGHTDARAYSDGADFSNWELSSDRANACRRELVRGGVAEEKIARVVGLASTVLFDKSNPLSPINRRISIVVMNKETEDAMLRKEENEKYVASDAPVTVETIEAAPVAERVIETLPLPKAVEPVVAPPVEKPIQPALAPAPVKAIEPTPAPAKKIAPAATPVPVKTATESAKLNAKPDAALPVKPGVAPVVKSPRVPSSVQLPGLPIKNPATGIIAPAVALPPKAPSAEQNKTNP